MDAWSTLAWEKIPSDLREVGGEMAEHLRAVTHDGEYVVRRVDGHWDCLRKQWKSDLGGVQTSVVRRLASTRILAKAAAERDWHASKAKS